jgi:YQGE family putative transporter
VGRLLGAGTFLGTAYFGNADDALRYALCHVNSITLEILIITTFGSTI